MIVDEAHACVGTHKGKQQRFELLSGLAKDPERRIIMLTATPHSGDEEAFSRLLSLIDPAFASLAFDDARYRERLARHFVQRRRIDLVSKDWGEDRAFPKHKTTEAPYRLDPRAFGLPRTGFGLLPWRRRKSWRCQPRQAIGILGHACADALCRLFPSGGIERSKKPDVQRSRSVGTAGF